MPAGSQKRTRAPDNALDKPSTAKKPATGQADAADASQAQSFINHLQSDIVERKAEVLEVKADLKLATQQVELGKETIAGLQVEILAMHESLKRVTDKSAGLGEANRKLAEDVAQLKATLTLTQDKLAEEQAAAEAAEAAGLSSTDGEDEGPVEKGSAGGRKSGQRGGGGTEHYAAAKVQKAALCYPTVDFDDNSFFAATRVHSKADLGHLVWAAELRNDKKKRSAEAKYSQKTFCTSQAECVLTLLSVKEGEWCKTSADGAAKLDLGGLLKWHASQHKDGTGTDRRWAMMGLLHPGKFATVEVARGSTGWRTWEAVGKYVTAVNKVGDLYEAWKKNGSPNRSEEDKAKLSQAFMAVVKPERAKPAEPAEPVNLVD